MFTKNIHSVINNMAKIFMFLKTIAQICLNIAAFSQTGIISSSSQPGWRKDLTILLTKHCLIHDGSSDARAIFGGCTNGSYLSC